MSLPLRMHEDRYFPSDPQTRDIARRLFAQVERLPIVSPHGHTDPQWFSSNRNFEDPVSVFLWPDHYLLRMLTSQGLDLGSLGVSENGQPPGSGDRRAIWRRFASHYHLFRATPSRLWLDHVFASIFGLDVRLGEETADRYYDRISEKLGADSFRPRSLFRKFNLEVLATTEPALDPLTSHTEIRANWDGRIITTFRPDDITDPDHPAFAENLAQLGAVSGHNTSVWSGYLAAIADRRAHFRAQGATATDHGHPTPQTADLSPLECQALLDGLLSDKPGPGTAELFRAQMLTEMAKMSADDGMVMQIHPGSYRNHNAQLFARFGRDKGGDIPVRTEYVRALKPLLDRLGNESNLRIILFTLDETNYTRELAPLAGHYPVLKLGPAWWFHDSPEGMLRFRRQTTETAGFYNTVGFNDDTRAFFSIPARHDLARRIDAAYLAELVATHRLEEDEAAELIADLAYNFPKAAYRL